MWAPIGERPVALGHHRFEWLYVTGFVEPTTGRTVWNVSNGISKAYFECVLADFAKSAGAGPNKRIVLQLDNAGWHGPENLAVPDGIRLVFGSGLLAATPNSSVTGNAGFGLLCTDGESSVIGTVALGVSGNTVGAVACTGF